MSNKVDVKDIVLPLTKTACGFYYHTRTGGSDNNTHIHTKESPGRDGIIWISLRGEIVFVVNELNQETFTATTLFFSVIDLGFSS